MPDDSTDILCKNCRKLPRVVNYYRKGKTHYRPYCTPCGKEKKKEKELANQLLAKSGYAKKKICDRCGFNCRHPSQMRIVYLDGNKLNVSRTNLRTHCANCVIELVYNPSAKKSDLIADY